MKTLLRRKLADLALKCREGVAGNPGDRKCTHDQSLFEIFADDMALARPPPAEDEDPAPMKWLLNHRTDFTDNGWGQLCGAENMKYGVMGGHHFSMMKGKFSLI